MTTVSDKDRDRILVEERNRIAEIVMSAARDYSWCNEVQRAWDMVYPGVPLVDRHGFDTDGWRQNEDGSAEDRDGQKRPPQPDGTLRWCGGCGQWE